MSCPLRVTASQWSDIREHYEDEPDPDDFEELPTHCLECGIALEADEELLCGECVDELRQPPEPAPDEHLEEMYEDRQSGEEMF